MTKENKGNLEKTLEGVAIIGAAISFGMIGPAILDYLKDDDLNTYLLLSSIIPFTISSISAAILQDKYSIKK